jgi:hypothetical protein
LQRERNYRVVWHGCLAPDQIITLDQDGIGMDALFRRLLILGAIASLGAGYRTPNFVVTAQILDKHGRATPMEEFAKQVGDAAEVYRKELAIEWTGNTLPGNWSSPCPINVNVGMMGAGGATTFNFQNGEVYGWKMDISGSQERILDSVLPHEINHTIFASYFRRPLPRWADEGAASLIEHGSERMRLRKIHDEVMGTIRRIPLRTLLEMKNYPKENRQVLALYAEGHSLADYLIQRSDKPTYLKFLQLAYEQDWNVAFKKFYEVDNIDALEKAWEKWVVAGSRPLNIPKDTQLADNTRSNPKGTTTVRGQSPDAAKPAGLELPVTNAPALDDKRPQRLPPTEDLALRPLSRHELELPLLTQPAPAGVARFPHDGLTQPVLSR